MSRIMNWPTQAGDADGDYGDGDDDRNADNGDNQQTWIAYADNMASTHT